jgi:hypothetical protein
LEKRDQAPRKIPVTEHGAPAKLKMDGQKSQPEIGLAFGGS